MGDPMDQVGVGKFPTPPIPQHCSVLPACLPQLIDRLHIVLGDLVPYIVALLPRHTHAARGALSRYPVTIFQPTRPFVRWSKVDIRRAKG